MAVVRITKELTTETIGAAMGTFSKRIKDVEGSVPAGDWGMFIYETIFKDYLPLMNQLPANFFGSASRVIVSRIREQQCSINFEFGTTVRWPSALPDNGLSHAHWSGSNTVVLSDDPVWDELYGEITNWIDRCDKVRAQARQFREGVEKVLTSYTTLGPALKAWPPLWELIPEWAKNKHKEIVVRKPKEEVEIGTDLGALTAVMASRKLMGGNQ